ncbi:WXG100 family type VII secretion target [Nocardia sp. NPDC051052]|uniref:WXG100 family type VII secretion target n=1 Tax=Nocardia sp. NPDC051052 TaxID=3364322 RepID=UPI0037B20447
MTGTEPPQIPPRTENPKGFRHTEIRDAFEPVETTTANDAATKYLQAQQKWTQGLDTFRQRMMSSIAESWEGQAAEASKKAIVNYTTKADQLTSTFGSISKIITDTAQAAVDVKTGIPEHQGDPSWYNPKGWPPFRSSFENKRNDAEEQARTIMRTYYVDGLAQADKSLPVLPRPVDLVQQSDVPPVVHKNQPSGTSDNTTDPNNNTGQPNQPSQTSDDQKKVESGSPTAEKSTSDQSNQNQSQTDPTKQQTTAASTTAADTTAPKSPSSTTPTTPTTTHPTTPGVPTGLTPRSPGSPGSPGSPTKQPASPGRSIPGTAGSPGTTGRPTVPAGATAARGAAGSPGMMSPGGGRGKGEDDSEHQSPDYLKTDENTIELLGETPPTIPGGVLGARYAAAQVKPAEDPPGTDR